MSENMIKIVNLKTGKEIIRDKTEAEIVEDLAIFERDQKQIADQQALKDSANAKLLALGLSPEEVAAITGA